MNRRDLARPVLGLMLMAVWGLLSGCDSSPPRAERQPQTAPATRAVAPHVPATQPASAATTTTAPPVAPDGATGHQDVPPPDSSEPELPSYVTVIERYESGKPARLTAATPGGRRLTLDTRNVRRIRIDRDDVPMAGKGSVALALDGQVFEWVANSQVAVFERSENGVWRPVPPDEARDVRRVRPKP